MTPPRFRVCHRFAIPVILPVNDAFAVHPFPTLAVEVSAYDLLVKRLTFTGMAGLDPQLAAEGDGGTELYLELARRRTTIWTCLTGLDRTVRIFIQFLSAATTVHCRKHIRHRHCTVTVPLYFPTSGSGPSKNMQFDWFSVKSVPIWKMLVSVHERMVTVKDVPSRL